MQIFETIKAHPYMTGGAVFVVGLIVLFSFAGGHQSEQVEGSAQPDYSGAIAANDLLAQNQIAGQVQNHLADVALQKAMDDNKTSYATAVATLQMQGHAVDKNAEIAMLGLNNDLAKSKLSSDVALANTKASLKLGLAQTSVVRAQSSDALKAALGLQHTQRFVTAKVEGTKRALSTDEKSVAIHLSDNATKVALTQLKTTKAPVINVNQSVTVGKGQKISKSQTIQQRAPGLTLEGFTNGGRIGFGGNSF